MPRPGEQVAKLEKILELKTEQYSVLTGENIVLKQRALALQAHIVTISQASTPWRDPRNVDSHVHQRIACCEAAINQALTQLGCTYQHSPVQGVLCKLQLRPDRVSTASSMPLRERAAVLRTVVNQLAVLLPKVQLSADGQWAQALQRNVESLIEMQLLVTFWDPLSNKAMNLADMNIETLEPQRCPKELVIEACKAMQLTDDQRSRLEAAWASSKACRAALLADFDKTLAALIQLQQQRQSEQQQFMQQAEQLPKRPAPRWLMQVRSSNSLRSSQQLGSSSAGGSDTEVTAGSNEQAGYEEQPQCSCMPATSAVAAGAATGWGLRESKCPQALLST